MRRRTSDYADPRDERIGRLEQELWSVRYAIVCLMPDDIQGVLTGYVLSDSRSEIHAWERDAVEEIIARADVLSRVSCSSVLSVMESSREAIPDCGTRIGLWSASDASASLPRTSSSNLPVGLARVHLSGDCRRWRVDLARMVVGATCVSTGCTGRCEGGEQMKGRRDEPTGSSRGAGHHEP